MRRYFYGRVSSKDQNLDRQLESAKKYKDVVAVDNLTLSVRTGELFSLLGVNGAGKTTLIRIINSITAPDKGEVLLARYDPASPVLL